MGTKIKNMLKKFNWGWGIAIFYSSFVLFMLFMVWRSTQLKTEMVTPDYYAKELKYQEQLDKMSRANSLAQPLQWTVKNKNVSFQFPASLNGKPIKAEVFFYRPNSSANDFTTQCTADSLGYCQVSSEKFKRGVYKMQVDWSAGNETYYNEGVININ